MIGGLHTWARDLTYHPHVHYVVPGGSHEGKIFNSWNEKKELKSREIRFQNHSQIDEFGLKQRKEAPQDVGSGSCVQKVKTSYQNCALQLETISIKVINETVEKPLKP